MGTDAIPSSMGGLPARLVLGPALRAQSDRRLVGLVRDGYESAFEEIVRRYRRPLDRFAASIVGGHSEDVTQDSFRKALEALRRGDAEVELRPWLYRIVRNTALNDLRDRPPAAAELAEELVGSGRSAAAEAEQRAEVAALTARMRALPEKQRAALVMRELEGMSHDEIAAALGISAGAARQAIARARTAVRSGFGALVPLPLLRALADGGGEAAGTTFGGAAAVGVGALKLGLATVLVAGSIGAGVAVENHDGAHRPDPPRAVASAPAGPRDAGDLPAPSPVLSEVGDESESRTGDERETTVDDRPRSGRRQDGDGNGRRRGAGRDDGDLRGGRNGADGDGSQATDPSMTATVDDHNREGRGPGGAGDDSHSTSGDDDSVSGRDGDSGSGRDGSGSGDSGSRHGGSGSSGSRGGGSGSDDSASRDGSLGSSSSDSGAGHGDSGKDSGSTGRDSGSDQSGGADGGSGSNDQAAAVVDIAPADASPSGDLDGSGSSSEGPGPSRPDSSGADASPTPTPSTSGSHGGSSSPPVEPTTTTVDEDSHSGGGSGSLGDSEIHP